MKKQLINLLMSILIISTAALISCSKGDTPSPPPPKVDTIPAVKHAGQFVGNPTLSPDTSFARTAGTTLTFDYVYGSNATNTIGSMDESKKKVTLPAMESSTSCTLSITGEDGALVSKTVPVPVFDTMFSKAVKGSPKWQMISNVVTANGGPPTPLAIDQNKYIYLRNMSAQYPGYREGTAILPSGNTANGKWRMVNDGAQYDDGTGTLWNNVSIDDVYWTRQKTVVLGTVTYLYTVVCKIVP